MRADTVCDNAPRNRDVRTGRSGRAAGSDGQQNRERSVTDHDRRSGAGTVRRRWRGLARAERGYVTAGTVVVMAAVTVLGVAGAGASRAVTQLRDGGAWLRNEATGTVTHVNGYSGRPDATVTVGKAGQSFTVVQRPDGAYVLDGATHTLVRIDGSTLTADPVPGSPVADGVEVVTGPTATATWLVDPRTGAVQQVDPKTLQPLGKQVQIGAAVGTAVLSSTGDLWAAVPTRGAVAHVAPGSTLSQLVPVGSSGDAISVVVDESGARVVALDTTSGASTPLVGGGSPSALPTRPTGSAGAAPVGGVDDSGDVVVVDQQQVAVSPSGSHSRPPWQQLPSRSHITQVAVLGSYAYLADAVNHQVVQVDLASRQIVRTLVLPSHQTPDLVLQGGVLFLNDPTGPDALAVAADGTAQPVQKYSEQATAPTPGTSNAPAPGPRSGSQPGPSGAPGTTGAPGSTGPDQPGASGPGTPAPQPGGPHASTATAPGAPTITSADPGNASASISWTAAAPNGSVITAYRVVASSGKSAQVSGDTLSGTLTNLTNGKQVTVRVQATNAVGSGPFSPPATVTPSKDVPTAPGSVSASLSGRTATIRWAAATAERTPIGHYNVIFTTSGGSTTTVSTTGPSTLTASKAGLTYGTAYTVAVKAVLTSGQSGPSGVPPKGKLGSTTNPIIATTTPGAPGLKLSLPASGAEIAASWSKPSNDGGATVNGYRYRIDGGAWSGLTKGTSHTFTKLSNGKAHTVQVEAHNAKGYGAAVSKQATPKAPPPKAPARIQLYQCKSSTTSAVYSVVPNPPCTAPQNWDAAKKAFTATKSHLSGTTAIQHCYTTGAHYQLQKFFVGHCAAGWSNDGASWFYVWSSESAATKAGYTSHAIYEYRSGNDGYWYGTSGQNPPSGFSKTGTVFWS
jgi:hypothetical protein